MHAYLGELEDVEHPMQSHFPEGSIAKLPLIYLQDIVRAVALHASLVQLQLLAVNVCVNEMCVRYATGSLSRRRPTAATTLRYKH